MSRHQSPRTSTDPLLAAPVFAGQPLDRADRERKDEGWVSAQLAELRSRAVLVGGDGVLIDPAAAGVARVPLVKGATDPALLLGIEDGAALFAVDLDGMGKRPEDGAIMPLREVGATLSAPESGLASYAMALVNWHRRHRFCANCGAPTEVREGGYMRSCPRCQATHFPRLDPVVIMLVEHDGRLLLGRRPTWPPQRYSALAGFMAPGESAEEAVAREVFEESGITAYAPEFVASQPWPFPSSLMLGFHARSDGGEPRPRDQELEDVRWFSGAEVRAALDEEAPGPLKLPPRVAIARFLIDRWLAR